ncbi:hypothetical protein, partial [Donghicola mangrovi]|uniref:hypothetical protein n=1 Tax=Donghicola mangrovi TaxID=2729614 RepID=UPI001D1408C9
NTQPEQRKVTSSLPYPDKGTLQFYDKQLFVSGPFSGFTARRTPNWQADDINGRPRTAEKL